MNWRYLEFPQHARFKGGVGRVLDPLGLTSMGKKTGGSLKTGWDPLGLVTSADDLTKPKTQGATTNPFAGLTAAPVTSSNLDVVNASQDQMRQEMLKKSIKKTIFAGDTGGYRPGMGIGGPRG